MGICLNMIVRNEAKTLPRLFASLQGQVDYYVIADTGSTDDTPAILEALGQQFGIPGEVHHHAWKNFAHNRNLALQAALEARAAGRHHCNWLMQADADEELVVHQPDWRDRLEPGCSYYAYKKTEAMSWAHLFLVWIDGLQWHWEGAMHNYLVNNVKDHPKKFLLDPHLVYHEFQGAKSQGFRTKQEKALADVQAMLLELQGQPVTEVNCHRHYQLACCYANAGQYAEAWQTMKAVTDSPYGSVARRYSAYVFLADCLSHTGAPVDQAIDMLDQAISLDPSRKEAPYYKALLWRKSGRVADAAGLLERTEAQPWTPRGYLTWEEPVYRWKLAYELVFVYYQQQRYAEAFALGRNLLDQGIIPSPERSFLESLLTRIPA